MSVPPLHRAARDGNVSRVSSLLSQGEDINQEDVNGYTPLLCASLCNHSSVVSLLIQKRANINKQSHIGWSPLMSASQWGYDHIVSLLLEGGAEINLKNNEGKSALDIAREQNFNSRDNNKPNCIRLLEQAARGMTNKKQSSQPPSKQPAAVSPPSPSPPPLLPLPSTPSGKDVGSFAAAGGGLGNQKQSPKSPPSQPVKQPSTTTLPTSPPPSSTSPSAGEERLKVTTIPSRVDSQVQALSRWFLSTISKISDEKANTFALNLIRGGAYSVEMLRALLETEVLTVDRLVNEMKFLRPVAQIIKKFKFSPISGHIGEEDLTRWLELCLGDLPPPVMKETLDALDDLGYFTLEMLRGDEELNLTHLVNEGKVNEMIAHTLLLNLNRERESSVVSLLPSPSLLKNGDRESIARASIEIKSQINSGGFSTVYNASWRGIKIALKVIRWAPSATQIPNVEREISILQTLRHPRVLILMGVCRDLLQTEGNIALIFELMECSLYQLLHDNLTRQTPDLRIQLKMCLDIADGMKFLHSHDPPILHRDLKSGNILIDGEGRCKIADFGLSTFKDLTSSQTTGLTSTPAWTDPLVLNGESKFTESSDSYSFGIIVWEIFKGEIPWKDQSTVDIIRKVGILGHRLPIPDDFPNPLKDLLLCCFGESNNRPTFVRTIDLFSQFERVLSNPLSPHKSQTSQTSGRESNVTLEEFRQALEEVMGDVVLTLQR